LEVGTANGCQSSVAEQLLLEGLFVEGEGVYIGNTFLLLVYCGGRLLFGILLATRQQQDKGKGDV
jgi:hypothetical protein